MTALHRTCVKESCGKLRTLKTWFKLHDWQEVGMAQARVQHARTVIMIADGSEFQHKAPAGFFEFEKTDCFITDAIVPASFLQAARGQSKMVHACEQPHRLCRGFAPRWADVKL